MRLLILCAALWIGCGVARATSMSDSLDEIAGTYASANGPGAAVLVMQGDEILLERGYGLANVEWQQPIDSHTSFRLGSLSKMFTALLVLRRAQSGLVDLDAPIARYIKALPTELGKPTVRQLLNHTSGLPDHFAHPDLIKIMRNPTTPDQLIELMAHSKPQFEPGTAYSYSNFNYVLLGRLLETTDSQGRDYGQIVEADVFRPLRMADSHYDRQSAIIPRRAQGYDNPGPGPINTITFETSFAYAAGALMSSIDDLARWSRALSNDQLIDAEWRGRAWSVTQLPNGSRSGYGLGFNVSEFLGEPAVWHTGSISGFQSTWVHLPTSKRTVVVLSNGTYLPNTTMIAFRLLATLCGQPVPAFVAHRVEDAAWQAIQGRYALSDGRVVQLHVQDGVRYDFSDGDWSELAYAGDDTFFLPGSLAHLDLKRDEQGKVQGFEYYSSKLQRYDAHKIDATISGALIAIPYDSKELSAVVGAWRLSSGDRVMIAGTGESLTLQIPNQAPQPLYRQAPGSYFVRNAPIQFRLGSTPSTARLLLYGSEQSMSRVAEPPK